MHDYVLSTKDKSKVYVKRLNIIKELIKEIKKYDWSINLNMIKVENCKE